MAPNSVKSKCCQALPFISQSPLLLEVPMGMSAMNVSSCSGTLPPGPTSNRNRRMYLSFQHWYIEIVTKDLCGDRNCHLTAFSAALDEHNEGDLWVV